MSDLVQPSVLGRGKCAVLFFGESPGVEEHRAGLAFVGPSGRIMRRIIEAELPGKMVVLDNAYPKWLGDNKIKPGIEMLREYNQYREDRIAEYKPQVIVLLGETAQKAFTLGGQTVQRCGKVESINGLPAVMSVHPAYILRNPGEIELLERVFRVIKACLRKGNIHSGYYAPSDSDWKIRLDQLTKRLCAFDIETSHLKPSEGRVLTAAIAYNHNPIWTDIAYRDRNEDREVNLLHWWSNGGPRIVHNLKFECAWMRRAGVTDPAVLYDTMLQAWLLDENRPRGLAYLLPAELGIKPYWTDLPRDGKYEQVPLGRLGSYNADDARYTLRLHHHQRAKMTQTQKELADSLFVPLTKLLLTLEERGVYIDRDKLEEVLKIQKATVRSGSKEVNKLWPDLLPTSNKQVVELVYGKMKLTPPHLTPKNDPSVDADALALLVKQKPELEPLARLRKNLNFQTRVLEPWLRLSEEDSRLHSTFNFVSTGRLSSSNPNLQNVDREGAQRFAMTSRFGTQGRIIQADYNQHEMRVFAAVSGCKPLLTLFQDPDADMHSLTAERISALGVRCDRTQAKRVNFGILYAITAHGLYAKSGIPLSQGNKLLSGWHKAFPELQELHGRVDAEFRKLGYVENMFGLRRRLTRPDNAHERRQAYNFPIQSAAVMISYHAMLSLEAEMRKRKMKSLLVLQIHDSIVVDVAPGEVKQTVALMKKHMLAVETPCRVPLAVDIKIGEHL